jgi:hypothetical protein
MLKLIAQNKYKLMVFIIGFYLLLDLLQHKGQTRALFPKHFPAYTGELRAPYSHSVLMNTNKVWTKGVNTPDRLNELNTAAAGFECDVHFDTATKSFAVHHDPGKNTGYSLDQLLQLYQQKNRQASIWLDIKNLDDSNAALVLQSLIDLRNKYNLQNKILVESVKAHLLTAFSDSSFFTAYYIPFFNPYTIGDDKMNAWADSIGSVISKAKINALSGYYFQSGFLSHYFAQYPVLTWVDKTSGSLVNFLFQRKMDADKSIFIVLKP